MRVRGIVWVALMVVAGESTCGRPLLSQDVALAARSPRFLYAPAKGAPPVEIDASRNALLRRVVSLQIAEPTVGRLLADIERQTGLKFVHEGHLDVDRTLTFEAKALTLASALAAILHDAGVDVVLSRSGYVSLVAAANRAPARQGGTIGGRVTDAKSGNGLGGVDVSIDGTRWQATTDADGRYRVADVAPGRYTLLARRIGYGPEQRPVAVAAGHEATVDVALQAKPTMLEDVVVTTQKREERLIDVPQSVSVLSADQLAQRGAVQFRDFANTVPGLSFTTEGAGYSQISLRGVTTGGLDVSSTVGLYVDEVPYGSSNSFTQGPRNTLDVALFDLDRIEVLRGPQGTLYGASTMGGLIKYVSKQPDAARFSADAQAGVSGTRDGGVSGNGALAVNAPIVHNKVAVRASGYYSRDGGYIDNATLGLEDVNSSDIYGGRADVFVAPADALTIRITGFLQNVSRNGTALASYTPEGAPEDGSLDQRRLLREPYDQRFRLISATGVYGLGATTLTSVSSYQTTRVDMVWDGSRGSAPGLALLTGLPVHSLGIPQGLSTKKFTQELRMASETTGPFEWLIGGFYTRETSELTQEFVLRDAAGQRLPVDVFTFANPTIYEEYAAFGDLTYHLTSKFDVTGGMRYAHNRQEVEQFGSGLFTSPRPSSFSNENVATFLGNARYRFSDHATGYLRFATGYRPGGPNLFFPDPATGRPQTPAEYEADRLRSYEVGFKAESADRVFGVDLTGFYIDWSNILVFGVTPNGLSYKTNAGGATVRGVELALTTHPVGDFTVTGAFAYQHGKLTDPTFTFAGVGTEGERLPNVPRISAAVNADYELPGRRMQPTVGATLRYVDDRKEGFGPGLANYRLPEYTTMDLRAGIVLGAVTWQLSVRNLFDRRGQLSGGSDGTFASVSLLQPRTVGITATTRWR